MASQMVIPASNDTLFIRGFSSRHHIDDIRDFFTREGGRNTVEFFKETNVGDGLFIALKFESKSIAKEVLNRFDGYEVMGDRISLSWYKDIRKARSYDNPSGPPFRQRSQNQQWGQDRYDYRGGPGGSSYSRGRSGQYNRGSGQRQGGWYPRGEHSEGGGSRTRRFTRSSSHSRSRSGSARSRSRSYSRSSSRDDRDSRSRSGDSRERPRKRQRSVSDSSRRRSTGRKGKGRDYSSASRSPDLDDLGSHSDSDSVTPPPRTEKTSKKVKSAQKKEGALSAVGASEAGAASAGRDSKAKDLSTSVTGDFEESDINDFSVDDLTSPQPVPPPSGKSTRAVRSAVSTVDKPTAASKRLASQKTTSVDDAIEAANVPPNELAISGKKQTGTESAAKTKKLKADRRLYEDPISDDDDPVSEKPTAAGHKGTDTKRLLKDTTQPSSDTSPTNLFEEPPSKRKVATIPKRVQKEFDQVDNEDVDDDVEPTGSKSRSRRPGDAGEAVARSGGRDDKGRRTTSVTTGLSSSTKRAANSRDGGVLGLSHEKMLLVRQKKDEIEKAYRQDCETFATVTKMLINKEPSLEDKIQDSLRENLKEIGQRCIQELREFIERLREEDEADMTS